CGSRVVAYLHAQVVGWIIERREHTGAADGGQESETGAICGREVVCQGDVERATECSAAPGAARGNRDPIKSCPGAITSHIDIQHPGSGLLIVARDVQLTQRKPGTNHSGVNDILNICYRDRSCADQAAPEELDWLCLGRKSTPVKKRETCHLLVESVAQGIGLHFHRAEVDKFEIDRGGSQGCGAIRFLEEPRIDKDWRGA